MNKANILENTKISYKKSRDCFYMSGGQEIYGMGALSERSTSAHTVCVIYY